MSLSRQSRSRNPCSEETPSHARRLSQDTVNLFKRLSFSKRSSTANIDSSIDSLRESTAPSITRTLRQFSRDMKKEKKIETSSVYIDNSQSLNDLQELPEDQEPKSKSGYLGREEPTVLTKSNNRIAERKIGRGRSRTRDNHIMRATSYDTQLGSRNSIKGRGSRMSLGSKSTLLGSRSLSKSYASISPNRPRISLPERRRDVSGDIAKSIDSLVERATINEVVSENIIEKPVSFDVGSLPVPIFPAYDHPLILSFQRHYIDKATPDALRSLKQWDPRLIF